MELDVSIWGCPMGGKGEAANERPAVVIDTRHFTPFIWLFVDDAVIRGSSRLFGTVWLI